MTGNLAAIPPTGAIDPAAARLDALSAPAPTRTTGASFAQMLLGGVDRVNQQVVDADAKAAAFVLDDSQPPHEVIFALEKARLSMEMMLQVRSRLVEGYQEIMRIQL